MKRNILAAALTVALWVGAAAFARVGQAAEQIAAGADSPLVVAHRAGAALGPENTLEALEPPLRRGRTWRRWMCA